MIEVRLSDVSFIYTNVIDIKVIQNLTKLAELCLSGTRIKDISPLQNQPNLLYLELFETNVSKGQIKNEKSRSRDSAVNARLIQDICVRPIHR